ncbi:MAG: hypothetical protein IPM97_02795 [Bdellovibrionaceae bacterium]|nr:hypothetical protein [Pseudobdellovibrionaceae bacterium]
MKMLVAIAIFMSAQLINVATAFAYSGETGYLGPVDWDSFHGYMQKRKHEDHVLGTSYMISGVVAIAGGVIGYYSSSDPLSRGVYAVAQSVGVAAIGYGANVYWIGNEYNSFYHAIEGSTLTRAQKSEVLTRFLVRDREYRKKANWIQVATHSLVAAVNFYSATREEDRTVRNLLYFLAGTNAAIAFSYAF